MGWTMASKSFFCFLYSSGSASAFCSNHLMDSSMAASILTFSSSLNLAPTNFSASLIMRSISSGVRRFWSLVMTIFSLLPVPLSSALTWRIPLASISKLTSIWGIPRGAGGMPVRSNLPNKWLSLVMGRSPSKTWMVTVCWLSEAVEKIWDFLVGMTVLRGINLVMTPPTVSIPIVKGLTSSKTMASVSCSPESTPAWTAAP
ncbi:hypothetical protein FF38_01806 [Lucilia cuprina]|uniref:Secreted protein n=1 Tax=Lucilia cuprina TaxID=7375 RepID=A0A0L0C269_LUCCU|nr:hypothetical protein FF38_01806 [Lucilia cuprina]